MHAYKHTHTIIHVHAHAYLGFDDNARAGAIQFTFASEAGEGFEQSIGKLHNIAVSLHPKDRPAPVVRGPR